MKRRYSWHRFTMQWTSVESLVNALLREFGSERRLLLDSFTYPRLLDYLQRSAAATT